MHLYKTCWYPVCICHWCIHCFDLLGLPSQLPLSHTIPWQATLHKLLWTFPETHSHYWCHWLMGSVRHYIKSYNLVFSRPYRAEFPCGAQGQAPQLSFPCTYGVQWFFSPNFVCISPVSGECVKSSWVCLLNRPFFSVYCWISVLFFYCFYLSFSYGFRQKNSWHTFYMLITYQY